VYSVKFLDQTYHQFAYHARQVYPDDSNGLYESYLDATRRPHGYLLLDFSQDTNNRLRFRTDIFPSEVKVVYTSLGDETDRSNYQLQALKSASPRLRKAIVKNSDRDLVLGIAELALNVLKGNCKIFRIGVDWLHKHKTFLRRLVDKGIVFGKKKRLICSEVGSCSLY
jgi:hypothetical protein